MKHKKIFFIEDFFSLIFHLNMDGYIDIHA